MNKLAVILTDDYQLSKLVHLYLESFCRHTLDSVYMAYGQSGLSGSLYRRADLFILGLLRQDDIGYRAEGLSTAEKMAQNGYRILLISGCAAADKLNSMYYWDLAAADPLHERINHLLKSEPPPYGALNVIKEHFRAYCRPAIDHHRLRQNQQ